MVNIPNVDGRIWNIETKTADIIAEYQSCGSAVVVLNNEGPDAAELGIYSLLDYLCMKFGFEKSKITVVTRNQLEQHPEYCIEINPPWTVPLAQHFAKTTNLPSKEITKHFGIFIGRSNWQRLYLSSHIHQHYQSISLQTFHYTPDSEFHKSHLGFDQLIHEKGLAASLMSASLINNSPLSSTVPDYPIVAPENFNIAKLYKDFFVEVVCETYNYGNTFFPTEKIWRPMMCRTPFLIQGPRGFLKNLRKMGFQTFSNYWDESYDEDGIQLGIETILQNLKMLSLLSVSKLDDMYVSMKPILDNNYEVFMNIDFDSWQVFK
jgi:hypothetical protein